MSTSMCDPRTIAPTIPSTAVSMRLTGSLSPRAKSLPEPMATMPSGLPPQPTALAPSAIMPSPPTTTR